MGKIYGGVLFAALALQFVVVAISIDGLAHIDGIKQTSSIDLTVTNSTFQTLSWVVIALVTLACGIGITERKGMSGRLVRWTLAGASVILLGFAALFSGMLYPPQVNWLYLLAGIALVVAIANWFLSDVSPWRTEVVRATPDHLPSSQEVASH